MSINNTIRKAIQAVPAVFPYLTGKARFIALIAEAEERKTYDYMLSQIQGLVRGVYNNNLGGDFIDVMANVISGQMTQAYQQAFEDAGFTDMFLPEYLQASLTDMIANQYSFVDNFFRDIVDARIDGTPIAPLLQRAELWAGQWDVAYKEAAQLINIEGGGNLVWRKGDTEKGCTTCAALDGIVMSAREWEDLDVHPRGYPNNKLECEGGGPVNNCDCELVPTDQRRSPKAYDTVLNIVSR